MGDLNANIYETVAERILARDPAEEIKRAFQLFDDDKTGRISVKNLKRVVRELNEQLDDDELCVLFAVL
jgi:centrin-3